MYKSVQPYLIALLFFAVSCQKSEFENSEIISEFTSPNEYFIGMYGTSNSMLTSEKLSGINAKLKSNGANFRIAKAELITIGKVENVKNTIVPKELGSKRLDTDFVPGDLRRKWSSASGNNITYAIDKTNDIIPSGGNLSSEQSIAAIKNAFNTWNDIKNTDLNLTEVDVPGKDIGFVASTINDQSGSVSNIFADIQIAGWGDIDLAPGVLAVTYTFTFVDGDGNPSDVDNNRKYDAAFREIYFASSYKWSDNGISGIDIESIALHEIGHGLSQGHFGTPFVDDNGNIIKITPRAVMNAYYMESFRILQNTDLAGHNNIWVNWPNK